MSYYFTKKIHTSFETAEQQIRDRLSEKGFGVLTEIDVQSTFKKKLDVDFYKYKILGACNPQFAHRALSLEDKVGVMLPCNVILQQKEQDGDVEVSAVDPLASMQAVRNENLVEIAQNVQLAMKQVIEDLK